ncbi:S41 family peptidase [Plebeiibacterium marinum]|uniref:S41 family peptidase n=1 Tax=Plebeiibacterium marinum TaxID=2992111 RepID=A0AAE3MDP4_9BACT|nr:S41 family peptidase [Plebeiobacterium marinum]MCW3805695.1 S41 family peptidase [Plebeiobacterium marinum]
MKRLSYYFFVVLPIVLFFASCEDDKEEKDFLKINTFINENMEIYYLWNDLMPELDPAHQEDPEDYFYELIYDDVDRWSFITDDAQELSNYFAGIVKEMGYSLQFYYAYENNTTDVVAIIQYVEPDSPADKAGLTRGDIIIKVNGESLTINNYRDLYNEEELVVGKGELVNDVFEDLTPSVSLLAEELQINPILTTNIFEDNGHKVGYLAYTSFINEFDDDLKAVFANFKSEGISDLILDLRYNGGGSVATAKLLAGMIGPASINGDIFIRISYNDFLNDYFNNDPETEEGWNEDYFELDENNLNLGRLYVLTTSGTASASEMVMYSLMPYMEVIQIGEQTHGKYYASITIDDDNNQKDHNWAIQPIIMRSENKTNNIDYTQGLIPDEKMYDNYSYALGDENEVLTAAALDMIWGTSKAKESLKGVKALPKRVASELKTERHPMQYEMVVDIK